MRNDELLEMLRQLKIEIEQVQKELREFKQEIRAESLGLKKDAEGRYPSAYDSGARNRKTKN